MKDIQNPKYRDLFDYTGTFSNSFDFDPTKAYDPINNYLLAQLCGLSYKDKEEIRSQILQWNNNSQFKLRTPIIRDIDSFRYIVIGNDDFIIIVFRGSDNLSNWLADFDITMVPFDNNSKNLVHQGFRDSVLSMQNKINKDIAKMKNNNQNIYITGHSLGGSQAILSGFMCKSLLKFAYVTTFGEPKVGDYNLCSLFNLSLNSSPASKKSRIYRNVNSYDPVPYLPTNYLFKMYYHEGLFYLYSATNNNNLYEIELNNILFDNNIMDMPDNQEELLQFNVNRHSINEYIFNAEANKTNPVFGKY